MKRKPELLPQPFAHPLSSLPKNILAAIRKGCPEDLKTLEADGLFALPLTRGNVIAEPLKDELRYQMKAARDTATQYKKLASMLRDPRLAFSFDAQKPPDDAEIERLERRALELERAAKARRELLRKYPKYPYYSNQRVHHVVAEILKHKPDFDHWEELESVTWVALRAMGIKVHDPAEDDRTKRKQHTSLSAEAMRKEAEEIRKVEKQ